MSKFLINLLLQIFKALVNSKIQFLIQKSFSLLSAWPTLRPVWPLAQPAHRPRRSLHAEIVSCTTSAECKTVITAVLTGMSGMDPHMIRWNLGWVWFGLVGWFVEVDLIRLWLSHSVTP
jgi:hypothetical protein